MMFGSLVVVLLVTGMHHCKNGALDVWKNIIGIKMGEIKNNKIILLE